MQNYYLAVGNLKSEIQREVGFDCEVILCASHDTAPAVMAIPDAGGEALYIRSGTWSLMGVESETAHCDEKSRLANLTNEGGYDYRFRYLKNIMGLRRFRHIVRIKGSCRQPENAFTSRLILNSIHQNRMSRE